MKERVSALMDGELGPQEAAGAIGALASGGEARETWKTYHLIGDALRDTRMLSAGFADRVVARIGGEPTVLAPQRPAASQAAMRWSALAAGVAAAAFVGWVAFSPQDAAQPAATRVANAVPAPAANVNVQEAAAVVAPPAALALVPPPPFADDYLFAHQGYSPRTSFLGVAPYVRVAGDERKQ